MKFEEITFAARTIGEHTIDLRAKAFVKDNATLLSLIEKVKGLKGVKELIWTEAIEVIGRKNPPNDITI